MDQCRVCSILPSHMIKTSRYAWTLPLGVGFPPNRTPSTTWLWCRLCTMASAGDSVPSCTEHQCCETSGVSYWGEHLGIWCLNPVSSPVRGVWMSFGCPVEVCQNLFCFTGVKEKMLLLIPFHKVSNDSTALLFIPLWHTANDGCAIRELLEISLFRLLSEVWCVEWEVD